MIAVRSTNLQIALWAAIAALLLIPLVAMKFTAEVTWTPSDFAFAALLLGGAGLAYEIVARHSASGFRKLIVGGGSFVVVVLIWLQGAVGIV